MVAVEPCAQRTCLKCFRTLDLSQFGPTGKGLLRAACRECERVRKRSYPKITPKNKKRTPSGPAKDYARSLVRDLVRQGRLKREACKVCGLPNGHAHHEDYSKPLEIEWLCSRHHGERHRLPVDPSCLEAFGVRR